MQQGLGGESGTRDEDPCDEDKTRILVLFTESAENTGLNPNATAEQSIVNLQGIWVNSNIDFSSKVELAGVLSYNFTETQSIDADLTAISVDNQVNTWRDLFNADIVVVFTDGDYGNHVGRADVLLDNNNIVPDEDHFICIVQIEHAVSSYFVFTHEVAHIFGANHGTQFHAPDTYANGLEKKICNPEYNPSCYWSLGLLNPQWVGTIMRSPWENDDKHTRIDYFSNPNVYYQEEKIGDEDDEDNHRKLNEEYEFVSGYREDISTVLSVGIAIDVPPPCEEVATADASVICGTAPFNYQWKKSTNGGVSYTTISGATSSSYVLEDLIGDKSYCVQVVVTDANSQTASSTECFFVPNCCDNCPEKLSLVNHDSSTFRVSLTPTLGTGKILLTIDNQIQETSFSCRIVSLLGREIQSINSKVAVGTTSFPITLNASSGIYYLQIVSAEFVKSIPFIISEP